MNNPCNLCNSEGNIENTIPSLKAVSDENRLKILFFLKDEQRCVCEIVEFLQIPQNLVSHHLKVLRDNELVISEKKWLNVHYSLNKKQIDPIVVFFNSLLWKK